MNEKKGTEFLIDQVQSLLFPGQVSHVRSKQKATSTMLEMCLHYEYLSAVSQQGAFTSHVSIW